MVDFRRPGPVCSYGNPVDIDDGTLSRCASQLPGILQPDLFCLNAKPEIRFDRPVSGQTFQIDASDPATPRIRVEARIAGVYPDPSSRAEFGWRAQVRFDSSDCPNGEKISGDSRTTATEVLQGSSQGGVFTLDFQSLSGGELDLSVFVQLSGRQITGTLTGVRIEGANPTAADIKGVLSEKIVWRIIQQESRAKQFIRAPDAGGALYPYFSEDHLLGVGLGQITNPPPTTEEMWDWKQNVKAAERKYRAGKGSAQRYPQHCRDSARFKDLVKDLNDRRRATALPPVQVELPDFTTTQLERAAVRAYNGCAGRDNLGHSYLHEYRVALDANGRLVVDLPPGATTATATWEVVPLRDRPSGIGDPDYVNHVYAQPA
ncbi:MAG: hypothetical protein PHU46_14730 [Rhodocyclaceae bacterium]|nr:hypothetical protein [Rhodocyclaceae bacterium]